MEIDVPRRRRRHKPGCFTGCNAQFCCSYLLSFLASGFVIGGFYLSYNKWDTLWLMFGSGFGFFLILIGSCFYYKGTVRFYRSLDPEECVVETRSRRRRRGYRTNGLSNDQLMPTAPSFSESRTVSQYSLNMIPQYFSATLDSEALSSNFINTSSSSSSQPASASRAFSQIFSVNGQSFLILPISEAVGVGENYQMQNIVLRINDNDSDSKKLEEDALSDSKRLCVQQACQTENEMPKIETNHSSATFSRRDVQLQTLPNHNDVVEAQTSQSQVCCDILSGSSSNCLSSDLPTRTSNQEMDEMANRTDLLTDTTIQMSTQDRSLNASFPLINFDESSTSSSEEAGSSCLVDIQEGSSAQASTSRNAINESLAVHVVENLDEFRQTAGEPEEIDNRATPPPSYEEVFDDGQISIDSLEEAAEDPSVTVFNYGTL